MQKILIGAIILAIVGAGAYFLLFKTVDVAPTPGTTPEGSQATTTEQTSNELATSTIIGTSVEGRNIVAYHYGQGSKEILFVGGIHGGYSSNTALVAYELMEYLEENPEAVPAPVRVTVVPVLNPDGLSKVVEVEGRFSAADVSTSQTLRTEGRFNANNVDLNRNFDCEWKASALWQSKAVSGGSKAFSEPESQAIRAYIEAHTPAAAVVWYSAAGGVYASNCLHGVLPETTAIMNVYADASLYPAHENFDFYAVTGDMVNWLAKNNIPAISVLLTNHADTEWAKNRAGIGALLEHYAE